MMLGGRGNITLNFLLVPTRLAYADGCAHY